MGSVLSHPSADVSLRLLRSAAAWTRMCWPPPTASGIAFRPPTPVDTTGSAAGGWPRAAGSGNSASPSVAGRHRYRCPGLAPRAGLTGTGGGMLQAARATPSRAGGIVVIPGSPPGFELDRRGWGRLRSSGQAQRRPGVAGPGTVVSARRLAAAGRRASSRRPPDETGLLPTGPPGLLGPSCSVRPGPCGDCGTSTIYRNACARTAAAHRPRFLAGRPCHTRTELCATGRSVSTDRRPIHPM
jgi:hypothetical protein